VLNGYRMLIIAILGSNHNIIAEVVEVVQWLDR
jgi:hypothetical protein